MDQLQDAPRNRNERCCFSSNCMDLRLCLQARTRAKGAHDQEVMLIDDEDEIMMDQLEEDAINESILMAATDPQSRLTPAPQIVPLCTVGLGCRLPTCTLLHPCATCGTNKKWLPMTEFGHSGGSKNPTSGLRYQNCMWHRRLQVLAQLLILLTIIASNSG